MDETDDRKAVTTSIYRGPFAICSSIPVLYISASETGNVNVGRGNENVNNDKMAQIKTSKTRDINILRPDWSRDQNFGLDLETNHMDSVPGSEI